MTPQSRGPIRARGRGRSPDRPLSESQKSRGNGTSVWRVGLCRDGGFEWTDGNRACRIDPDGTAFRLGGDLPRGWRMERATGGSEGFVVVDDIQGETIERGRSSRSARSGE